MAGHYPLKKTEEPTLFNIVESIKGKIALVIKSMGDFSKFTTMYKGSPLYVMKLSKDYVESPETEIAFTLGKVNLKSLSDQHKSLTHQINVEVHLSLKDSKVEVKNIFWVA
jgi:hypothetical protein